MKSNSARSSSVASPVVQAMKGRAGHRWPANDIRRSELALAVGVALAALAPAAIAAPATAHWTLTDLGRLGDFASRSDPHGINTAGQVAGFESGGRRSQRAYLYSDGKLIDLFADARFSQASGINNAGQVTGSAVDADRVTRAFVYGDGTLSFIGTRGSYSEGAAINAGGEVTGTADFANADNSHAFLYSNGQMRDLGTLGGGASRGYGINDSRQVTGTSQITASDVAHAFLYSNGRMVDLGTLGGEESIGLGINNAGQVTGYSAAASGDNHAFLYGNGTMFDLGTLGGEESTGFGINKAGQVVGSSQTAASGFRAFLYDNGAMIDLNTVNGVAGGGDILTEAKAINDAGQITVVGRNASYLMTLDTTVWEGGSSGSFASGSGWSHGIAPNRNTAVFIDPVVSTTIAGPTVHTTVRQLTVGGERDGNNGIATLVLNGGTLEVLGSVQEFRSTVITAKGVLTGDGTITGHVRNEGTVRAVNLSMPGGLTNFGTVTGHGVLSTDLENAGLLRVDAGQLLKIVGTVANTGSVELRGGGELQVSGRFTNVDDTSARLVLDNATVRFKEMMQNNGQLLVTFGGGSVFGAVTTGESGKIILSGRSNTTFYDAVYVERGGELRVSAGSAAVFFGSVFQATGAQFTGTGTKYYEGGLGIGGSPGLALDGGDVNLGAENVFAVDIGGTTACTADCATDDALKNSSFDRYVVAGHLGLGGTLKLESWQGFTLQAGQRFDLLDWGSVDGSFDSIDTNGLLLAAGTALDTSQLAIDGSFRVTAVPEPGSWALLLVGLVGGAGWTRGVPALRRAAASRSSRQGPDGRGQD